MTAKKAPTKKTLYFVEGTVDGIGTIGEHIHAYSVAQAFLGIAERLEDHNPHMRIFIQNRSARVVPPKNSAT